MISRAGWAIVLSASLSWSGCGSDPGDDEGSCTGDQCDDGAGTLSDQPLAVCKAAGDFKTKDGRLACTPCADKLADASGRGFLPRFIGSDALLANVYMSFEDKDKDGRIDPDEIDCPVTMPAIMDKLNKLDADSCVGDAGPIDGGNQTRVVSETAALLRRDNAAYRTVTSRICGGRTPFGLLFSLFGYSGDPGAKGSGLHITEPGAPGEVEIIAFDPVEGVFNFYKEVGDRMRFFGSSTDFVVAGPGGPSLTSTRGCANCHPGGGLNMKELQAPWTHWSQTDDVDGDAVLVESRKDYLGRLDSGVNMEFGVTEPGNSAWNKTKVQFLKNLTDDALAAARATFADDKLTPAQRADLERRQLKRPLTATQLLLQPLFCSVQVNINASGGFVSNRSLGSNLRDVVFPFPGIDTTPEDYVAAITAVGSEVPGLGKPDVTGQFMIVERSHEDNNYVLQLQQTKPAVIDAQFAKDVAMVDFTRPILSDDRCGLLELVPDLAPADRTADRIRDGMIDSITAAKPKPGSPAAELRRFLTASRGGTPVDHQATITAYGEKCSARPPKELLRDAVKLRSLQRKLVYRADEGGGLDAAAGVDQHPFAVFEFEQSMPADKVQIRSDASPDSIDTIHPDARLSPKDCGLTSAFVSTE